MIKRLLILSIVVINFFGSEDIIVAYSFGEQEMIKVFIMTEKALVEEANRRIPLA